MSIIEETLNRLKTNTGGSHAGPDPELAIPPGLGEFHAGVGRRANFVRKAGWLGAFIIVGMLAWIVLDYFKPSMTTPPVSPLADRTMAPAGKTTPASRNEGTEDIARSSPPVVPAAVPDQSPAEPAPPVAASAPTDEVPAANRRTGSTPAWLAEGRRLYLSGDRKSALDTWNAGFATLPDTTRLFALSAHPDASGALAALSRIDDFDGVFVANAAYRGKPAWRVLLFADADGRRTDVRKAVDRLGIKGWAYVPVSRLKLLHAAQNVPAGAPPEDVGIQTAAKGQQTAPQPTISASTPTTNFDDAAAGVLAALDRHKPEAVSLASELARAYPERIEPLLWRARAELIAGQADTAEKTLAEAASRAPHLAEVWLLRGIAAQERNRHDEALGFLEEAYRLAPKNPDVLFNLALSARQTGALDRARVVAEIFLDLTRDKTEYAGQRALLMRDTTRAVIPTR